jgi:hypothetical protein
MRAVWRTGSAGMGALCDAGVMVAEKGLLESRFGHTVLNESRFVFLSNAF